MHGGMLLLHVPSGDLLHRSPMFATHLWPRGLNLQLGPIVGCRLLFPSNKRIRFVVNAEISDPFSPKLRPDTQKLIYSHDTYQSHWFGPVPGDIAEVEAYCRIFRAAEGLHAALMDSLCNPFTGECTVPYDYPSDEKPLLEDKIVSVLGCIISLLNKGREDVLSGRTSAANNSFHSGDVSIMEDTLPPLAVFRNEMKRCCESLHVALEDFLTPNDGDERNTEIWRKLQRLKNVCYDTGFARNDDSPPHVLLANWRPVYLSMMKEDMATEDSEVAFWKGGQVTEEGLKWMIMQGFKTIVDLRAETVKDRFYQEVLDEAVLDGKIELVQLPVEIGTAPTMEQVENFAALVADCRKRPLYLHSREGVWRTSAMVSRWRQYMSRLSNQYALTSMNLEEATDGVYESLLSLEGSSSSIGKDGVLPEKVDSPYILGGTSNGNVRYKVETGKDTASADNNKVSDEGNEASKSDSNEVTSQMKFTDVNPMRAQIPPQNFFSRKEMSGFLQRRSISPPTYLSSQHKNAEATIKRKKPSPTPPALSVNDSNINGSLTGKNLSTNLSNRVVSNGDMNIDNRLVEKEKVSSVSTKAYVKVDYETGNDLAKVTSQDRQRSGAATSVALSDDGYGQIEGNMCASATGVVRVQSRKKAEMFLVRTDGFSCTREKVTESSLAFTHPSTQQQMLMWKSTPKTVLLLKKLGPELMEETKEVASFLYHQEKMNVLVEPEVHDILARIPGFGFIQTFYSQDTSDLHERVDFVACMGGDGVILHASNLFRGAVPPVVSFNLGSLGFLTSHTFEDYRNDLRQVIHGNNTVEGVYITLRMRLHCEIFRNGKAMPGKVFDVLNEVVVDRGSNPYLSKIECYEHDHLITKVQGDGVIVATPTGSTAYSTAAGGSMVHPNVPCMLFTPICPHSLSFRPVILPDSARLELKIPEDARSNAWVSFDGKRRQQLSRGDSVRISMSQHPLPTVNKSDQTGDWFHSLIRCLNWNERLDQKALWYTNQ
ncbi:hypothetical protein SAY87_023587 [Trapa incisa]|uniref:NAD(+) kinase n=1 Tax=Trapa incisa TaxID=236973 RepID=A0AAN7L6K0_9MYRT|nr:hypothetical protein SAY87_023587 [Trapa incisa]